MPEHLTTAGGSSDCMKVANAAVKQLTHIATLPEVTLGIIELVENPRSSAQALNGLIGRDPALSARVLRVVNSAFYGLPQQLNSINRAISLLGLNAVKNIAIAASLAKLFKGGELTSSFAAKDLWTHSNVTAAAAKMIANSLKLGLADEAFLAGLMHDIGIMVEMQVEREKLIQCLNATGTDARGVPCNDFLAFENEIFGATHQDFGSALCEKWKFPKSLVMVTGYHHRPMDLSFETRTLSAIVYVADRVAAEVGSGFRHDILDLTPDPAVMDSLKLTQEKLADIKNQVATQINDLGNLLT